MVNTKQVRKEIRLNKRKNGANSSYELNMVIIIPRIISAPSKNLIPLLCNKERIEFIHL